MKTWKLLLPVPFLAALLAMAPQDPKGTDQKATKDISKIVRLSSLQYVDSTGKANHVSSRNVVEVRLLEDALRSIRLEILYENGDYSMIDAQAIHIIRSGNDLMDVRLVRSPRANQRFPQLP